MNHILNNNALPNELPPMPAAVASCINPYINMASAPAAIEPAAEQRYDRRGFLSLLSRGAAAAAVAKVGIDLIAPKVASADPEGPVDVDDLLEQLEDLPLEEQKELIDSIRDNLDADTKLKEVQREELEKGPAPAPVAKVVGDVATQIVTGIGILSGLGGGWVLLSRHFKGKKAEQQAREEALRVEENAQRLREDEDYAATVKFISDKLEGLANMNIDFSMNKRVPNYEPLVLVYSQLRRFAENPRFTEQVFNLTVSLLKGRAKAILEMHPDQIEARLNADREVMYFFAMTHSRLPRQDAEGNPLLPGALGISFDGLRYHRRSLRGLNLEGAWIRNQVITGSMAGSRLKQAHFEGSTFGELEGDTERGGACDLRGTDLSRADLHGARFEHVLVDKDTKFGEGVEGDPRATFGTVVSDGTLSPEQVNEKIAAAQAIIDKWQQDHPEAEAVPQQAAVAQKATPRIRRLLGAVGVRTKQRQ